MTGAAFDNAAEMLQKEKEASLAASQVSCAHTQRERERERRGWLSEPHTRTQTLTRKHSHANTHTHTHTRTHAYTHTRTRQDCEEVVSSAMAGEEELRALLTRAQELEQRLLTSAPNKQATSFPAFEASLADPVQLRDAHLF